MIRTSNEQAPNKALWRKRARKRARNKERENRAKGLCGCGRKLRADSRHQTCAKCRRRKQGTKGHRRVSSGTGPPPDYDWDGPWKRLLKLYHETGRLS